MDFLTILKYTLAAIETAALLAGLVTSSKGFREHKDMDARRLLLRKSAVYFVVYVALNILRVNYFGS